MAQELTHLDAQGRAQMVDLSGKAETERVAIAKAEVILRAETRARIAQGEIAKGEVLSVARVAGILAAKRTHELIPLCHPLLLTDVEVRFDDLPAPDPDHAAIEITGTAKNVGKTGVEMEALVAVANAALTIYDMVKAIDRRVRINNLRLVYKAGGKSGELKLE
jgi:cyclic pyranopterin phosphate synthase